MTKTQNALLKRAVIRGIIRNCDSSLLGTDLGKALSLLLNENSVQGLKPFNFIRNSNMLHDDTGLVQEWFDYLTRSIRSESVEIMAAKRVKRGIECLSKTYDEFLPEVIQGKETLAVLFRVFYLGDDVAEGSDLSMRMALSFIVTLLRTMILLEMISDNFEVHGRPADYWLERLLMGASSEIGDITQTLICIRVNDLGLDAPSGTIETDLNGGDTNE